ncbi:MAG: PHP domain-containing protein [Chloroflexia bacterium]|nr:PHP domain-containing protein [Chloroflexia bacterium]
MSEVSNWQIASLLLRHAKLLELAGESAFRSRAFSHAAESVQNASESIAILAREDRIRDVAGVGQGIATAIEQILTTGSFAAHDELTSRFPETLVELITVPGIGAKTAQRLFLESQIDSLVALENALESGKIRETKSLGLRIETVVRSGLEQIRRRTGRMPLGIALPLAEAFMAAYRAVCPADEITLAGSARRWEITVADLDFVIVAPAPDTSVQAIAAMPMVSSVTYCRERTARVALAGTLHADLYFSKASTFAADLLQATGSTRHLELLGELPAEAASEEEIYANRGFTWIPPELRAGYDEFDRSALISLLVTDRDIHGEFHAHTTWSDGSGTIREMAEAAEVKGYSFLGITDHSHGLGIAGGLDEERLAAQRYEISSVERTQSVKLLAGAEVEVHRDGSLDFDYGTLARLDVVVASLHSGLRQPRAALTERLMRVLENPNVDIIAHPSGRLIERRESGDFDWERVFTVAARTGTALEINADPSRLDLDPRMAQAASGAGCLITINSDAHNPSGFSVMKYGVKMARKAWLKPEQILNCWSRERILEWLAARNPQV